MLLRFGDFEIDTIRAELRGPDGPVPVEPKTFDLLLFLAENPGRLLTRDEMIARVWGGRAVSDSAVATVLKQVRKALGDSAADPHLLKTVHGRGHRFTAEVRIARPAEAVLPAPTDPAPAPGGQPTLAVLPFRLFSPDPRLAPLADAIPAEIISALSRLRWLRVLARESCFRFRSEKADLTALTTVLGAGYVLTGRMEAIGRRLAISVDLADTRNGGVIWSDRLEGGLDDVHELRHQIVSAVIVALDLAIPLNETARARLVTTDRLDAWGAYHLGMSHAFRFTRHDNAVATGLFRRATTLDPGFASAFAALSFTCFQDAIMGFEPDRAAAVLAVRRAAEQSVILDPLDPQANAAMGRLALLGEGDAASVSWLGRSVNLSPSYAKGHYSLAFLNVLSGDAGAAHRGVDQAIRLSPLDPMMGPMMMVHALGHAIDGDLDAAAEFALLGTAAARNHVVILMVAAAICHMAGRQTDAERLGRRLREQWTDFSTAKFLMWHHFADKDFARRMTGALAALGFSA